MKIGVAGLGVGYALACSLAQTGYEVIGVDLNPQVVANPRRDKSLEALFRNSKNRRIISQRITLTTDYGALQGAGVIIVCVSTGDERKLVLGHVEESVRSCLRVLSKGKKPSILIVYSTLPFGSSRKIVELFREAGVEPDRRIGYCHMPLMIAQGTTANDFVNPPFVAFGSYSKTTAENARRFYLSFIKRSALFNGKLPPNFVTTPEIAELAKLVANAFLSTKISFANMVARFCEIQGLDGEELLSIVGSDWVIGDGMFKAGYAIGGACLPRDLRSLLESFESVGVAAPILQSVHGVNEMRVSDPVTLLDEIAFKGRILVAGLSYKAYVNDTRASPGMRLLQILRSTGREATGYDPNITTQSNLRKVIQENNPEAIIITTREREFESLREKISGTKVRLVLDYSGIVDATMVPEGTRVFKAGKGWLR